MSPDFYCIGAQKCGTTWLYQHLCTHPEVSFNCKEVHFWDQHHHQGLDWYKGLFREPGKKQGDITPAYATLPQVLVKKCYRSFPDLKIIYIVREPVERALSALRMELSRNGATYASADRFLMHLDTIRRGDYKGCLDAWLRFYDRNQILVLHFEDLATKPLAFLKACCGHIGVDPEWFVEKPELYQKVHESHQWPVDLRLSVLAEEVYKEDWVEFQKEVVRVL